MNVQTVLHAIDGISTWVGKAAAWLIIALMTVVCVEVFKRYILNAPTAWIFDLDNMLYGAAEIVRCIVCLKTGKWPSRLKDVTEIDVVEEQLAQSEHVDEEARKLA